MASGQKEAAFAASAARVQEVTVAIQEVHEKFFGSAAAAGIGNRNGNGDGNGDGDGDGAAAPSAWKYRPKLVEELLPKLSDACVKRLHEIDSRPFKFIVACFLTEKTRGGGVHNVSSTYWDGAKDSALVVRWENDSIACIANIFAVSL